MTVHNLYLFDRNGACLHYSEWNRKKQAGISKEEEFKLMYGMLFSIRSFVSKMSPVDMKDGFLAFQTSKYKLHYYETPSGLKVVMNTDLGVGNIQDILHQIYSYIYVEYVVKNPLCSLNESIQSELFRNKLDSFVRALPFFFSSCRLALSLSLFFWDTPPTPRTPWSMISPEIARPSSSFPMMLGICTLSTRNFPSEELDLDVAPSLDITLIYSGIF